MQNTLLLLMLLSTGIGLSAQQNSLSAPTTFTKPTVSESCPVYFGAEVNSRAIVRSIEDRKKNGDSPLLKLTFVDRINPKILSASVTIHGLSSSIRYLPVGSRSSEDRTQTFELGHQPGSAGLAQTEVYVTKMLFVRWAEVTELRYADGSAWHPSPDEQCQTVPSGFRLINQPTQ